MDGTDREELVRARERLHKIEATLVALRVKIDLMHRRVDHLEPKVERLSRHDEIAQAVAQKLKERGDVISINWMYKLAGLLIAACAVVGVVLQAAGR
jgi:hypothetical protein